MASIKKKILFGLLTIVAVMTSIAFATPHFSITGKEVVFPLNRISVQGDWKYLDVDKVYTTINELSRDGFVGISLNEIKNVLEQEPWIREISVRRVWPDRIHVNIFERKPLALWGNIGFVDSGLELVRMDKEQLPAGLPHFMGPESAVKDVTEMYREISQMLSPYGISVSRIILDERRSWKLVLSDGVFVNIGSDNLGARKYALTKIYKSMDIISASVKEIDLRYSSGFALKMNKKLVGSDSDTKSGLL